MNQLEIKLTIDISSPENVTALSVFLGVIGGSLKAETPKVEILKDNLEPKSLEEKVVESPKILAPKKSVPKKSEVEKGQTKADLKEDESEIPTSEKEAPEHKIEDVRKLLSKKVNDHREAIKSKLTKLGAPNVSNMDKSKYGEFMEFLENLD